VLSVPVLSEDRILGVLSLSAPQAGAFSPDDERVASLLATIAGQHLRIAELERLAITDTQTGAFNRGVLIPRIEEEMARCRRTQQPLSLLLMDLDFFKRVNDDFGHAAGDEVLFVFAQTVRESVRSIDVFVRRGGEEFVLVMPSTSMRQAADVAERVRTALASRKIHLAPDLRIRQTVSIGVATWDGLESPSALGDRADRAMYEAKRRGRNRVILAG
jgi:diguanylate cyclase (GGDEF)-like protein